MKDPIKAPAAMNPSKNANSIASPLNTSLIRIGIPIIAGPIMKMLFKNVIRMITNIFDSFFKSTKPSLRSCHFVDFDFIVVFFLWK